MHLYDLTHLLRNGQDTNNTFYCNNSIMHWRDDLFLMTFRRIHYRASTDKNLHPWKIWDNAYKYLYKDPERLFLRSVSGGIRKHGDLKFKDACSPDVVVSMKHPRWTVSEDAPEFDSTGMCIVRLDGNGVWTMQSVCYNLFGKDMAQDARLCSDDVGELYITYNAFFRQDRSTRIMKRRFIIRDLEDGDSYTYFFEEEPLDILHPRRIEKNCVMHRNNILYEFRDGSLVVHTPHGIRMNKDNPVLQHIMSIIKPMKGLLSLGSPPISYRDRHIATAHIKIPYRDLMESPPSCMESMMSMVNWSRVYKHGKFIYYMMLYEFDDSYRITRVSNGFIPTDDESCHLPYLLCFSTGMTRHTDDKIILTFGEGDTRCKALVLDPDDVDNMLMTQEELTVQQFRMDFLNVNRWRSRRRILHYGYFYEHNCGDDMFMQVLRILDRMFIPDHKICFRNQFKAREIRPGDIVMFGGGDVINPYFLKDVVAGVNKIHAVSVGVPYKEFIHLYELFHTVITRNPDDVPRIASRCYRAAYFPDLGFLLPRWWGSAGGSGRDRIGISIPRNYYQKDSMDYVAILEFLARIIRAIQREFPTKEVWLIPFCIQPDKHYENDRILNEQLAELCPGSNVFTPSLGGYIREVYDKVGEMELMICGRFHAHIFAICHGVPFVSISSSRKCRKLMQTIGIADQCITLGTNTDERPIVPNDPSAAIRTVLNSIGGSEYLRQQMIDTYNRTISPECDNFIEYYKNLLVQETTEENQPMSN